MLELATLIARHARYRPDATAVVFETIGSLRQFWERVARVGNMLRTLGIGPGDKVATVTTIRSLLETYGRCPRSARRWCRCRRCCWRGAREPAPGSDARCLVDTGIHAAGAARDARRTAAARAAHRWRGRNRLRRLPGARGRAARHAGAGDGHERRPLQHHVHERHDRAAKGHRAHALRARDVLHAARRRRSGSRRSRAPCTPARSSSTARSSP